MSDTAIPQELQPQVVTGSVALQPPNDRVAALSLDNLGFGSSSPLISRSLYGKASQHNDQLTKAERLLFLSRRDLLGKALAYPESLTEVQQNEVLGRPPPDVLAANIKLVTGLGTIAEVLRDFWLPDRTAKLRYGAQQCITLNWWTFDSDDKYRIEDPESWIGPPANAAEVLVGRMRPEEMAFEEAVRNSPWEGKWNEGEQAKLQATTTLDGDDDEEECERLIRKRKEEYMLETSRLRKELESQLQEELRTTTEDDVAAMKELMERMRVEAAEDADEDARLAEVEAAEKKRQQEKWAEERRQKRRRKAARKAAKRVIYGASTNSSEEEEEGEGVERGEGAEEDSDDSDDSGFSIRLED